MQDSVQRPHEAHMAGPGRMHLMGGRFTPEALRQQLAASSYAIQAQVCYVCVCF